jgi:hypothetical protein
VQQYANANKQKPTGDEKKVRFARSAFPRTTLRK